MYSNKCNLPLNPVTARESGEGLPYAPMDFPLPGDIWVWKVGHRITSDGFMRDRCLYPPKRFKMFDKRLLSKKAVIDFIKTECPNTDLDDFWSSFHWRIPAKDWVKGGVSHLGNNDPILFESDNESVEGFPYAPSFPKPVSSNESGEGLPYAPVDFPKPGDIWVWKAGHRISGDGYMLDRYLYPPKRFKVPRFKSKITVEAFITTECPNTDLDEFWSSFQWRIPAKDWVKGEVSHLGNNGHDDPILFESDNESGEGLPYAPNFPKPVSTNESGEGLPYAPVDFPKPGDIWVWRVGQRITSDGFMRDRYLYPPKRMSFHLTRLASKKQVEDFITTECPSTNLDDFWSSFHWMIPAKDHKLGKGEVSHLGNNGHDGPIIFESDNESVEGLPYAPSFPKPVSINESGEGLPYAPVDFPKPGDIWVWKVGHRISSDGYMLDRYLYGPKRFKMPRFKSKITVEAFITTECPHTNLDDFWSSFHWRIPAKDWVKGEVSHHGNNGHDDPILFESDNESGEGLPYAPMNFPLPGDIWVWKVGHRITGDGFMRDRYLYPPKRFKRPDKRFLSKKAVEHFIKTECPNTDLDDFWSSFHWRIPAKDRKWGKGEISLGNNGQLRDDPILSESDNDSDDILRGSKQDEAKTSPDHIDLVLLKLQNGNCLDKIRNVEEDISAHCAVREGRKKESPMKRKREKMEIKSVEKDIQKIIKRFPDGVSVAADDDCCSSCLAFKTTPLNKRVIKTTDLVSVAITLDMVKNEKHKSREWFTVEGGGNRTWISYAEVDGLNPRKWVTGNIIDWYGTKLREMLKRKTAGGHHQQFIVCNNFFYTILAADYKKHMEKLKDEEEYRDMDFHNRTAVFASKLNRNWTCQIPAGDVQFPILIPINYRSSHWALFVVHPLKWTVDLYDPLYNDHEALKNYDEEMNALITMLSMYYVHKDPTSNIEWVKKVCSDLPKQPNHYDCGVFVIAYMDCICREIEIKFDEQKGCEYFRYILARDLLEDGGELIIRN